MTSRPAVPDSETPDGPIEVWHFARGPHGVKDAWVNETDYRSLERRLSLAQTEIKGHMRVEDELKAAVASLERKLDDIVNTMKHAGMKVPGWIEHTDQDGKLRRDNLTIAATLMFELEAWRARIAELEKAVSEFVVRHDAIEPALHGVFTFYSVHGMVWPADKNWKRELDALRAALKSRA